MIEFLLSEAPEARALREAFVFIVVPMLNPDGERPQVTFRSSPTRPLPHGPVRPRNRRWYSPARSLDAVPPNTVSPTAVCLWSLQRGHSPLSHMGSASDQRAHLSYTVPTRALVHAVARVCACACARVSVGLILSSKWLTY